MDPAHDDTGLRPLSFVSAGVQERAEALRRAGRHADAAKELALLASVAPRDPKVWLRLAFVRIAARQPAAAADAYLAAAAIYAKRGAARPAMSVARRALRLHGGAGSVARLRPIVSALGTIAAPIVEQAARAHLLAARPDVARDLLLLLLEHDEHAIDRRWQLAEVQLAQGAWADAVEQLLLVAEGLMRRGRIEEYVRAAEMALTYGGPTASLLRDLAAVYRRIGQRRKALAKLEQLHRLEPDELGVLEALARARAELGQIESALGDLRDLVAIAVRSCDRAQTRALLQRAEHWSIDPAFTSAIESLRVSALLVRQRRSPPPPPSARRRPERATEPRCTPIAGDIAVSA